MKRTVSEKEVLPPVGPGEPPGAASAAAADSAVAAAGSAAILVLESAAHCCVAGGLLCQPAAELNQQDLRIHAPAGQRWPRTPGQRAAFPNRPFDVLLWRGRARDGARPRCGHRHFRQRMLAASGESVGHSLSVLDKNEAISGRVYVASVPWQRGSGAPGRHTDGGSPLRLGGRVPHDWRSADTAA